MTEGAETLSDRIHTVECINRTLLNGYDRLTERISLQKGNVHAIKIMSKDIIFTGQTSHLEIINEGIRTEHWTGDSDSTKGSGEKI